MNNIFSEIQELLLNHIDEEFEMSELSDSPLLSLRVKDGVVGVHYRESLTGNEVEEIIEKYKFRALLPSFNSNFTILGYVENKEFFLFGLFLEGKQHEQSPKERSHFMELFNSNREGVKLRHVPVLPFVFSLPGAKAALENGSKYEDVSKYTIKAMVELCEGISPMTGRPRKGLVMKSISTNYAFKCYSESAMLEGDL